MCFKAKIPFFKFKRNSKTTAVCYYYLFLLRYHYSFICSSVHCKPQSSSKGGNQSFYIHPVPDASIRCYSASNLSTMTTKAKNKDPNISILPQSPATIRKPVQCWAHCHSGKRCLNIVKSREGEPIPIPYCDLHLRSGGDSASSLAEVSAISFGRAPFKVSGGICSG